MISLISAGDAAGEIAVSSIIEQLFSYP